MLSFSLGRQIYRLCFIVVVTVQLGFSAAMLISMGLSRYLWVADLANFIRPHLLVAGIVLFVVGLILPRRSTKIAGAAALLAAAIPFLLLPTPAPSTAGTPISVVAANVYVDNPDPADFLAIPAVGSADILVLQEVTPRWQDALLASGRWTFESSRDLEGNTDMKLFSRFPILDARTVSPESKDTGGRYAVRFELLVEERTVIVYAVHPQTPRSTLMWRERGAYLRDLERALRVEPADASVIVAGDWNTPPWSPFFRDLLSSTGYRTTDARWWPSPTRFSIRLWSLTQIGTPIDRIVVSPNLGLSELLMGPTFGSNHLPVIARLSIPQ
ncbi:endonuclease/exonuclease/phosphatase family protein [Aquibium sp. LZ166]|uniref:Endonuclease/exonuclease/phosphatase family protein n=1 Tax=Aquibium pacificus TaxID=3153579 RepID=A0ABV3SPR2_9HYPH